MASELLDLGPRYTDRGPIAAGGMGEVRRVWDHHLDCPVAMKILTFELVGEPLARERFLTEARITAHLQHPGIVAVFDHGTLADGRPWYTMSEVRGRTFAALIAEGNAAGGDGGELALRRLVGRLHRVCEAVGYAHGQGIVHRDLKPDNLMIGAFGEVRVMDWGLARRVSDAPEPEGDWTPPRPAETPALTRHGTVLGTPGYMAPEQARGAPVGPPADVYALGGVLYTILTGRPPVDDVTPAVLFDLGCGRLLPTLPDTPTIPPALREICDSALAFDPEERWPDARVLGIALADWLDGARRRAEAEAILAVAHEARPRIDTIRREAHTLIQRAEARLAELPPFASVELKREAWRLQDAAAELRREAAVAEATWAQTVRSALHLEPGLPAAHAVLADHYAGRLLEAEAQRRREDAATFETLLRAHDRGVHRALLAGEEGVAVWTDPPDATVRVLRFVERDRRLVTEPTGATFSAPLLGVRLPLGSYVLVIEAPGRATVRYPILVARDRTWSGTRPGSDVPTPIYLPRADELGPDDCYVPAGPAWLGGDPDASEALPSRNVWIDGYVVRRHPVTHRDYLRFLDSLVAAGREEDALAWAPRQIAFPGPAEDVPLRYERSPSGAFLAGPTIDPDTPVTMVDWRSALAYTRWEAERNPAQAWRLLDELEWEKAARGVDGRFFAWGDQPEPTWANLMGNSATPPEVRAVGSHPEDRSVYGVEGMMGNVRDWCGNVWTRSGPRIADGVLVVEAADEADERLRAMRGGAWQSVVNHSRAAVRFAGPPGQRLGPTGFRLARTLT